MKKIVSLKILVSIAICLGCGFKTYSQSLSEIGQKQKFVAYVADSCLRSAEMREHKQLPYTLDAYRNDIKLINTLAKKYNVEAPMCTISSLHLIMLNGQISVKQQDDLLNTSSISFAEILLMFLCVFLAVVFALIIPSIVYELAIAIKKLFTRIIEKLKNFSIKLPYFDSKISVFWRKVQKNYWYDCRPPNSVSLSIDHVPWIIVCYIFV